MKLVTANIKCNPTMSQDRVVHDTKVVAALGDVILWQEIAIPRYVRAVLSVPGHWEHTHTNRETPISYNKAYWEETGISGDVMTHKGRKGVSPNRYITFVGLRRKHTHLSPVIFMNTHMISAAFSNNAPFTKAWRLERWKEHFLIQQQLIKQWHSKGYTVIGGGDMNRTKMPKYCAEQRWLAQGGIDHIYCVEGAGDFSTKVLLRESTRETHVYTDHAPRIASLHLTR